MTSAVSGKTTYLVVGDDPGESKIKKATEKGVRQIDEDELLELIKTKPGKKSKFEIAAEEEVKREMPKKKPKKKNCPRQTRTMWVTKILLVSTVFTSPTSKNTTTEAITKKSKKSRLSQKWKKRKKQLQKLLLTVGREEGQFRWGRLSDRREQHRVRKNLNWLKGWG